MFALLACESFRHGGEPRLKVVGEFASDEEADLLLTEKISTFHQKEDGGGTIFFRLKEGSYIKHDDVFYVKPEGVFLCEYISPSEVQEELEPF